MPHKADQLSNRKPAPTLAPQKPSKAARARAVGIIGPAAVAKLEAAGLAIVDAAALEKVKGALS